MKKLSVVLAWVLIVCMLLSIVACSTGEDTSNTPSGTTTTIESTTTTVGGEGATTTTTKSAGTTTTKKPTSTGKTTGTTSSADGTEDPNVEPTVPNTPNTPDTNVTESTTASSMNSVENSTVAATTTTAKKPTTTAKVTTTTKKPIIATTTTKKPTTTTKATTTTTKKPTTTTTKSTATTQSLSGQPFIDFRKSGGGTIGVWWWNNTEIAQDDTVRDHYLEYLQKNQVTEIYLACDGLEYDQIETFIRAAKKYGMRVAWLSGSCYWLQTQYTGIVTNYLDYQKQAPSDAKCYALHLDVEPHQLPSFRTDRQGTLQMYGDYVQKVAGLISAAGEKIEWDIPFWFDQNKVTINGKEVLLLEYVAEVSDTICIMSYRDTATQIMNVSTQEIAAAKKFGCKIICGVETYSREGDQVSFMEEGKATMYEEMERAYNSFSANGVSDYGMAIHHLEYWYGMKVA